MHIHILRRCGIRFPAWINRGSFHRRHIRSQPNTPIDLDPHLKALLDAGDISLKLESSAETVMKELEVVLKSNPEDYASDFTKVGVEEWENGIFAERKSPAASYGSKQISQVILPNQLQNAIGSLISECDKVQLRSDAKRLFYEESRTRAKTGWNTEYEEEKYRSKKQAARHAKRDGIAFASIAHSAHYAAILAVFDHMKRRLEPGWCIKQIIDWSAGTGSGLWAAVHAFGTATAEETEVLLQEERSCESSIDSFLAIENRDGLVSIGKRLLRDVKLGDVKVSWRKSFKDSNRSALLDGQDLLALSAFKLSRLPASHKRKELLKEMWDSGAHVMVLIDHNSNDGFRAIVDARKYLLELSQGNMEGLGDKGHVYGAHVVAPCAHDGACPLLHAESTRFTCGFSQRFQRPSFVRRTKHSGVGHEDIGYSYVVIRRGSRPSTNAKNLGRVGEVGRRALEKIAMSAAVKEKELYPIPGELINTLSEDVSDHRYSAENDTHGMPHSLLQEKLRLEAFSWPRLVFPPLKRNGHVILDACTSEGKIMRMTIPRSQGKQEYYDARKSSWGDLFPHPPKNPPQQQHAPKTSSKNVSGLDIGNGNTFAEMRDKARRKY